MSDILHQNNRYYRTSVEGPTAIIRYQSNTMELATDLVMRDDLIDFLDEVSLNPDIQSLVLIDSPEKKGRDQYLDFYRNISGDPGFRTKVRRMCNLFDQYLLKITEIDAVVVSVISGFSTSQFLNVALAADYRIIGEETVFEKPYLELGTVPKGGGAYFLEKILGFGKARELLLNCEAMDAKQALSLGLVDKIVPCDSLEREAVIAASELGCRLGGSWPRIKRLLGYSVRDLADYLEFENREIIRAIDCPEFWRRFSEGGICSEQGV